MTLVPALFLAAISFTIIVYILRATLQPFLSSKKGFLERRKFDGKVKYLEQAEEQVEKGNLEAALDLLKESLHFDVVKSDPMLIKRIGNHHNKILSKLIIIAELKQVTLRVLPEFERLLEGRIKLLTIAYKHREKGKAVKKEWAGKHYADRIREVDEEVEQNAKEIQGLAIQIFTSLSGQDSENDVVIH